MTGISLYSCVNAEGKYITISKLIREDKIDVTAFMVWFIENYPNSIKYIKATPDYQFEFK